MSQPLGSIEVGGATADDQWYDLGSIDGETDTDGTASFQEMTAFFICRLPYWPAYLLPFATGGQTARFDYGLSGGATANQTITASYMIHGVGGTGKQIVGTNPLAVAWENIEGVPLSIEKLESGNRTSTGELFAQIAVSMRWTYTVAADDAIVNGIRINTTYGDYDGNPGVSIARVANKRVFSPGHFADAYLGTSVLCDTINKYVSESTIFLSCPIFGNTAV